MKIVPKTVFYVASATEQDVLNVKKEGGLLQPTTRMVSGVPITLVENQFLQASPTTTGRILLATPVSTAQTSVPAVATSGEINKLVVLPENTHHGVTVFYSFRKVGRKKNFG